MRSILDDLQAAALLLLVAFLLVWGVPKVFAWGHGNSQQQAPRTERPQDPPPAPQTESPKK